MCIKNKVLLGCAALFCVSSAQASVLYNWHPTSQGDLSGGTYATATSGQIAVTDTAYRSGSIDIDYDAGDGYPGAAFGPDRGITNSPILYAEMDFAFPDAVYTQPSSPRFVNLGKSLIAPLTFNADGTLSGELDMHGISTQFSSSGQGLNWAVFNVGSDYFGGSKCGPPTCSGGTGYWQVDTSTLPTQPPNQPRDVPAPSVWPLFGLAIASLFGAARRRTNKRAAFAT